MQPERPAMHAWRGPCPELVRLSCRAQPPVWMYPPPPVSSRSGGRRGRGRRPPEAVRARASPSLGQVPGSAVAVSLGGRPAAFEGARPCAPQRGPAAAAAPHPAQRRVAVLCSRCPRGRARSLLSAVLVVVR